MAFSGDTSFVVSVRETVEERAGIIAFGNRAGAYVGDEGVAEGTGTSMAAGFGAEGAGGTYCWTGGGAILRGDPCLVETGVCRVAGRGRGEERKVGIRSNRPNKESR